MIFFIFKLRNNKGITMNINKILKAFKNQVKKSFINMYFYKEYNMDNSIISYHKILFDDNSSNTHDGIYVDIIILDNNDINVQYKLYDKELNVSFYFQKNLDFNLLHWYNNKDKISLIDEIFEIKKKVLAYNYDYIYDFINKNTDRLMYKKKRQIELRLQQMNADFD